MNRPPTPSIWQRRLVWIASICAAFSVIYTIWLPYGIARQGGTPAEFLATWGPSTTVVAISLLIIAISRSRYTARLEQLEKLRVQELQETRSRLVHAAAHELRNPMTGLKGVLALLQRRLATEPSAENLLQLISIANHEVDRLAIFLDDFIDAFRVQEGRLEFRKQPVDLMQIIRAALQPFAVVAAGLNGSRFVLDGPADGIAIVYGDASRLEQVVRNLLSNALKYSPNETEILITVHISDARACVSIQDHGIGIPAEDLHRVFECFYRASNVPHSPSGKGLGLYISEEIVKGHNGDIWVESIEGAGTTFHVELPLYVQTSTPVQPASSQAVSR